MFLCICVINRFFDVRCKLEDLLLVSLNRLVGLYRLSRFKNSSAVFYQKLLVSIAVRSKCNLMLV